MGTLYENVILNNIFDLCESSTPKVSMSKMCNDLGLSRSLITKLKADPERTIAGDTAVKISDYFGVPVDRVLGSEQKEKPLAQGERLDDATIELQEIWATSTEEERQALLGMARLMKKRRDS